MADHEHCPHFQGGNPNGSRTEICCQCGLTRSVTVSSGQTEGHGPYIPEGEAKKVTEYDEWG